MFFPFCMRWGIRYWTNFIFQGKLNPELKLLSPLRIKAEYGDVILTQKDKKDSHPAVGGIPTTISSFSKSPKEYYVRPGQDWSPRAYTDARCSQCPPSETDGLAEKVNITYRCFFADAGTLS